ncbi:MAG: orotidine-5'-phosphate decarboxylase [Ilumatobacteraceae bacterium]|nr:orotidine-5'-phosphate decarboxylase [Ilumatobacteraceae bacterium]
MSFLSTLAARWAETGSLLCVGLDPDPDKFPSALRNDVDSIARFCIDIVDATAEFVCAFKPQIAYFAAVGAEHQLEQLCQHIRANHPTIPLILDAKRGDIGDTAALYAREAFDRYGAHAVTVSPYLGTDSIEPFLAHSGKGVFVLCRTSNAGSGEFQSQVSDGLPLYQHVATRAVTDWATKGEVGLVVGATYPAELKIVRDIVGDMTLLVPGIGAQGGDPHAVITHGSNSVGRGLIINSSRAILYASDTDHAAGAHAAARATAASLI